MSPHAWSLPVVTTAKVNPPETATGLADAVLVPSPSCPLPLLPQQYAWPAPLRSQFQPFIDAASGWSTSPGSATCTSAWPVRPPLVAVTVVEPTSTPVTSPEPSTVAMRVSAEAQMKVEPVMATPLESCTSAVSWPVPPMSTVRVGGSTTTPAGTWATTAQAVSATPSETATMAAVPLADAVTSPTLSTVAMSVSELCHVTCGSTMRLLFSS